MCDKCRLEKELEREVERRVLIEVGRLALDALKAEAKTVVVHCGHLIADDLQGVMTYYAECLHCMPAIKMVECPECGQTSLFDASHCMAYCHCCGVKWEFDMDESGQG